MFWLIGEIGKPFPAGDKLIFLKFVINVTAKQMRIASRSVYRYSLWERLNNSSALASSYLNIWNGSPQASEGLGTLGLILILSFLSFTSLFGQEPERYIINQNEDSLSYFLDEGHEINGVYNGFTPLEIAIRYNLPGMVKFLIDRGADINLMNNRLRLLQFAIYFGYEYHSNEIVELLVSRGADINLKGEGGNTPLLFACKVNNGPAAKLLFEKGADASQRDKYGLDFFFHVLHGKNLDLIRYFSERGFPVPRTKSSLDGPHIRWIDDQTAEITNIKYDSIDDVASVLKKPVAIEHLNDSVAMFGQIGLKQLKPGDFKPEKAVYKHATKIFAISDIHGNYKSFTKLLKKSGIINEQLDWIWGKGHLVVSGDVFDRGDMVTDCLWLIFKLEQQAEKNGGKVHYILGNHELMITRDDEKFYVNEKYIIPCAKLGIDYHDLFGPDYLLGAWIRSRNVVEKINGILFVHGGIPPDFVDQEMTIEKMNQAIHDYFSNPESSNPGNGMDLAIQPTWYRGYFENNDLHTEIGRQLKYYKAEKIVVGHTPVNGISSIQGGGVIAIGVPFDIPNAVVAGLLIEDRNYYVLDENGTKKELTFPGP